jgi:peptidoglycan/LPS O-acetylase OafA/YrhL
VVPRQIFFVSLLCVFLLLGTSAWRGVVQWRPLRFFGDISYGLYLYHLLAFELVGKIIKNFAPAFAAAQGLAPLLPRFAISPLVATGAAWLSRRTIEDYALSWKDKFAAARQTTFYGRRYPGTSLIARIKTGAKQEPLVPAERIELSA